jgi:hypothetical protein
MTRPSISRGGFITSDADERLPPGQISDMLQERNQKKHCISTESHATLRTGTTNQWYHEKECELLGNTHDEGVVEGGEDVRDAEDVLPLADGGAERHVLLLGLPRLPPPRLHTPKQDKDGTGSAQGTNQR